MQRITLWAAALAIALAAGFYLFLANTSAGGGEAPPAAQGTDAPAKSGAAGGNPGIPVVEIAFSETGYQPSSVTVKKGTTVRFVNNAASQETWPASAVHPTHSIYPEKTDADCLGSAFDACRGLKPGESWEFTFDAVGEWRFHDHIHASKTGVVVVTE